MDRARARRLGYEDGKAGHWRNPIIDPEVKDAYEQGYEQGALERSIMKSRQTKIEPAADYPQPVSLFGLARLLTWPLKWFFALATFVSLPLL